MSSPFQNTEVMTAGRVLLTTLWETEGKVRVPMRASGEAHPDWVVSMLLELRRANIEMKYQIAFLSSVIKAAMVKIPEEMQSDMNADIVADLMMKAALVKEAFEEMKKEEAKPKIIRPGGHVPH